MRYLVQIIILALVPQIAFGSIENPRVAHIKALMQQYKLGIITDVKPTAIKAIAPIIDTKRVRHQQICVEVYDAPAGSMPLFAIYEREAARAGIDPITMYAIAWHETGGFTSSKWRNLNNPGGIEYREFDGIPCKRHGRWAGFASQEDGIRAHAYVLSNRRYDGARNSSDPLRQVEAIGRGGYCEPGYNWTSQVKAYVRRFLGRLRKHDQVAMLD